MSTFNDFIFYRTYSKLINDKKETWKETVERYCNYIFEDKNADFKDEYYSDIYDAILNKRVMPSMRMFMSSGEAHRRENIAGYNCCYVAIDDIKVFAEILYILTSGCGVGFSVEKEYIEKLPKIPDDIKALDSVFFIEDSKLGWAEAYDYLIDSLFQGYYPTFNYSQIRPKGSLLKTFGGYASGPEPLKELFEFTINIFVNNRGKNLSSKAVHSIVCKIASVIVVGGVRRSALISLSDLDDSEMANAKSGNWWENDLHFSLANNSAVYKEKPTFDNFLTEWQNIYKSHSGERGMFSRYSLPQIPERRREINKATKYGCNPCSEILLRSAEFCNLSEVIVRPYDTEESLKDKIRVATIIGTIQSAYTNFQFLRPIYKENCEQERLLGVSMTGIFDNPITRYPKKEFLNELRDLAIDVNKMVAYQLNINPSVAITCIKPSGTVSALTGTSSGLHPAFSKYYIRRVRVSKSDPLAHFFVLKGIEYETDFYSKENYVFCFYLKSDALEFSLHPVEHLDLWRMYNKHFCEHKPSITITYNDNEEFLELGASIYKHFDEISGISVLPDSKNNTYKQAPFEAITEEHYLLGISKQPVINWEDFKVDSNGSALQCLGPNCEI